MTTTDHSRAVLAGEHSHGLAAAPQASRAARTRSFEVADFPLPTGREEEWRFSALAALAPALEDAPSEPGAAEFIVDFAGTPELPNLAPGQAPRGRGLVPGDRGAVVASKNTERALHVRIPADTRLDAPVRIAVKGQMG
ncbi:MAG: Fe-S cluster assembly protein SufD, partial [Ruaniaceae bacterium]|nr:Fe-S cluster assembly protein SufD [Ruaniaceae bacterium]